MWPLWLELLLGRPQAARCPVVDQVEEGRALLSDGERLLTVAADDGWREGDRLCPLWSVSLPPRLLHHTPAPPSMRRPTDSGDTDVR